MTGHRSINGEAQRRIHLLVLEVVERAPLAYAAMETLELSPRLSANARRESDRKTPQRLGVLRYDLALRVVDATGDE